MKLGDRHRPFAGDAGADLGVERGAFGAIVRLQRLARAARRRQDPAPAMNSGTHSIMPMVSAAPQEAELQVGLAEEFAERAEHRVADQRTRR